MSNILVTLGGKGIGIADQASIEPAKGCNNGCVGCYAAKTTRMGSRFGNVELKEYDDNEFRKSCKRAVKKGIRFVRMAKHCDPGDPAVRGTVIQILQAASEEGLRIVFVSKSLEYDQEVARALKDGKHILHMSLGMKTNTRSDRQRIGSGMRYYNSDVDIRFRVVDDVTSKSRWDYLTPIVQNMFIVTPMRFSSKIIAEEYEINLDNYEFINGYYRPKFKHDSWLRYTDWCGEVGDRVLCCNCGVGV